MATDPFDGVGELNSEISQTTYVELISARQETIEAIRTVCRIQDDQLVCDEGLEPIRLLNHLAFGKKKITSSKRPFTIAETEDTEEIQAVTYKISKDSIPQKSPKPFILTNPDYSEFINTSFLYKQTETNLVTNPTFDSNVNGWASYSQNRFVKDIGQLGMPDPPTGAIVGGEDGYESWLDQFTPFYYGETPASQARYFGPNIAWDEPLQAMRLLLQSETGQTITGLTPSSVIRLTFEVLNYDDFVAGTYTYLDNVYTSPGGMITANILGMDSTGTYNALLGSATYIVNQSGVTLQGEDPPNTPTGTITLTAIVPVNGTVKIQIINNNMIQPPFSGAVYNDNVFDPTACTIEAGHYVLDNFSLVYNGHLCSGEGYELTSEDGSNESINGVALTTADREWTRCLPFPGIYYSNSQLNISDTTTRLTYLDHIRNAAGSIQLQIVARGTSSSNQIITLTKIGTPTSGFFNFILGQYQSPQIAYNALAANVKDALESMLNIDSVDVTLNSNTYTIEFKGSLANTDFESLGVNGVMSAFAYFPGADTCEVVGADLTFDEFPNNMTISYNGVSAGRTDVIRRKALVINNTVYKLKPTYTKDGESTMLIKIYKPIRTGQAGSYIENSWQLHETFVDPPSGVEIPILMFTDQSYSNFVTIQPTATDPVIKAFDILIEIETRAVAPAYNAYSIVFESLRLCRDVIAHNSDCEVQIHYDFTKSRSPAIGGLWDELRTWSTDPYTRMLFSGIIFNMITRNLLGIATPETSPGLGLRYGGVFAFEGTKYASATIPVTGLPPNRNVSIEFDVLVGCLGKSHGDYLKCVSTPSFTYRGCSGTTSIRGGSASVIDRGRRIGHGGKYIATGRTDNRGNIAICFGVANDTIMNLLSLHVCAQKKDVQCSITDVSAAVRATGETKLYASMIKYVVRKDGLTDKATVWQVPKSVEKQTDLDDEETWVACSPSIFYPSVNTELSKRYFSTYVKCNHLNYNLVGYPLSTIDDGDTVTFGTTRTSDYVVGTQCVFTDDSRSGSLLIGFPDYNDETTVTPPALRTTGAQDHFWKFARVTDPAGSEIYRKPDIGGALVSPQDPIFDVGYIIESISIFLLNSSETPSSELTVDLNYTRITGNKKRQFTKTADAYYSLGQSRWTEVKFVLDKADGTGLDRCNGVSTTNSTEIEINGTITVSNKVAVQAVALVIESCEASAELERIQNISTSDGEAADNLYITEIKTTAATAMSGQRARTNGLILKRRMHVANAGTSTICDSNSGLGYPNYIKLNPVTNKLYWLDAYSDLAATTLTSIMSSNTDGTSVTLVYTAPSGFLTGIGIDYIDNIVYFAEMVGTQTTIKRIIDNTVESIATLSLRVQGISVDFRTKTLYLTGSNSTSTLVYTLDTVDYTLTLVKTSSNKRGSDNALDLTNDKLYIVSSGTTEPWVLMRMDLDGENEEIIFNQEYNGTALPTQGDVIFGAGSISLDQTEGKVYFTAICVKMTGGPVTINPQAGFSFASSILSVDLNGNNRDQLYLGSVATYDWNTYTGVCDDSTKAVSTEIVNAQQSIILPSPTGGTFDISFTYNDVTDTATLDYDITAEEFQAELESFVNIGVGNVEVSGSGTDDDPFIAEFIFDLGARVIPLFEADGSSLESEATSPEVRIAEVAAGAGDGIRYRLTIFDATSGTYTLSLTVNDTTETTANIQYNSTAADILLKLLDLSIVTIDDVVVSGTNPFVIEFNERLGDVNFTVDDSNLVCDGLALNPVAAPPYNYDLPGFGDGDAVVPELPHVLPESANVATKLIIERDLFDPNQANRRTIRSLLTAKNLDPTLYTPYLRNFSTGVLTPTAYSNELTTGMSIVLLSDDLDTDSGKSRVITALRNSEILPARMA